MNHKHGRTRNRGYQLTAEAEAYLSENHPRPYQLTPNAVAVLEKEKSHRQMVEETIDEFEAEQATKDLCANCVQGDWFIDPKDGQRKFMMPPYPTVDTICRVCGGYASPERKARNEVRWGENDRR